MMLTHNVVFWNGMILGHVKCGYGQKTLEVSQQMQHEGVEPYALTFAGALNACASLTTFKENKHFHQHIIQSGCEFNVCVDSSPCGNVCQMWEYRRCLEGV
jgi:pentatricopeptide repeat protein